MESHVEKSFHYIVPSIYTAHTYTYSQIQANKLCMIQAKRVNRRGKRRKERKKERKKKQRSISEHAHTCACTYAPLFVESHAPCLVWTGSLKVTHTQQFSHSVARNAMHPLTPHPLPLLHSILLLEQSDSHCSHELIYLKGTRDSFHSRSIVSIQTTPAAMQGIILSSPSPKRKKKQKAC